MTKGVVLHADATGKDFWIVTAPYAELPAISVGPAQKEKTQCIHIGVLTTEIEAL